MKVVIFFGAKELLGAKARPADVVETVRSLNRNAVVRLSVRVLNTLAYDLKMGFSDDQSVLVGWLPEAAKTRYAEIVKSETDPVRLFHPFQQLVLIHLAARYGDPSGRANLSTREALERWAIASIQINDQFPRNPFPNESMPAREKVIHFLAEQLAQWELISWANPNTSLARLLYMLREVRKLGSQYAGAAEHLEDRFPQYLGLDFETAFNLTAFLIYWWEHHAGNIPNNPDAALINRRTFLENTTIPSATFDKYLEAVSAQLDAIPAAFDALGAKMSFHEILPFRRRPLLQIGTDGLAILCPQLLAEKGGIDLFWLLSHEPGGPKEKAFWIEDFGHLYEGYVKSILSNLGDTVGGRYVPDIPWQLNQTRTGQIDGLLHEGRALAVMEVKGSFIAQRIRTHGTADELRDELERKFIVGEGKKRKGVRQIVHAIQWLWRERRENRRVVGIDLHEIELILPVLVVADRALRFPGLGEWFDFRMRAMVGEASMPWRIGALTICGLEDLENLEQESVAERMTFMQALKQYNFRCPNGEHALWETYDRQLESHPRLKGVLDEWLAGLRARGILLA